MSREVRLLLIIVMGSFVSLPVAGQDETEKRLSPAELFKETSPAIVRVCAYDAQGRQTTDFGADQPRLQWRAVVRRRGPARGWRYYVTGR